MDSDHPRADGDDVEALDEREQMLLRGLSPSERREAERFARIAATLVLAGWSVGAAWDRANALLEEAEGDDELPELFADDTKTSTARQQSRAARPAIAPAPGGERPTSAGPKSATKSPTPIEATGCSAATYDNARESAVEARRDGVERHAMPAPKNERTIWLRDKIVSILNLGGPAATADELSATLAVDRVTLKNVLKSLRGDGLIVSEGHAANAAWRIATARDREAKATGEHLESLRARRAHHVAAIEKLDELIALEEATGHE